MITQTQMYWITRLDPIITLMAAMCFITTVVGIVATVVGVAMHFDSYDSDIKNIGWRMMKCGLRVLALTVVLETGRVLVPTTKEVAAILVVPKILNNEKLQDAGAKLYDLAVEWMEDHRTGGKGK